MSIIGEKLPPLPEELWVHITSYLIKAEDRKSVACVSRFFRTCIQEHLLQATIATIPDLFTKSFYKNPSAFHPLFYHLNSETFSLVEPLLSTNGALQLSQPLIHGQLLQRCKHFFIFRVVNKTDRSKPFFTVALYHDNPSDLWHLTSSLQDSVFRGVLNDKLLSISTADPTILQTLSNIVNGTSDRYELHHISSFVRTAHKISSIILPTLLGITLLLLAVPFSLILSSLPSYIHSCLGITNGPSTLFELMDYWVPLKEKWIKTLLKISFKALAIFLPLPCITIAVKFGASLWMRYPISSIDLFFGKYKLIK